MIGQQHSLTLNSVLTIHIISDQQLIDDQSDTTTIVVNATDPISSIFDFIELSNSNIRLLYNEKILCPALSFAFYKIKNNDTIFIKESEQRAGLPLRAQESLDNFLITKLRKSPLNENTSLIHSSSLNIFNNDTKYSCSGYISNNKSQQLNDEMNCNSKIRDAKSEFDRLTDIYRFRIESNTKSFRKLCNKYRALVNSDSGTFSRKISSPLEELPKPTNKRLTGISSAMETVLPEKPSYPSTDFLPAFS